MSTTLERPGTGSRAIGTACAGRAAASGASVLDEIAARRRTDVERELARRSPARPGTRGRRRRRSLATRWSACCAPGLHLIAEIKRRSPSAGSLADGPLDVADRARAYAAGRCVAISVLVEPHWFGGSIEDLEAARAATSLPVLAKEFVVDPRQLPMLRAAGADLVLLLAALHPARRLARLVAQARDLGLEPLVEVARPARARGGARDGRAPHRHQQPRPADADRRPRAAERLRSLGPRRPPRGRGVRRPRRGAAASLARHRLRRGARRRGADARRRRTRRRCAARVAALVRGRAECPAGRGPGRGRPRARSVKICGVTEPRGPCGRHRRRRRRDRPEHGARHAACPRGAGGGRARRGWPARCAGDGRGPKLVGIFADRDPARGRRRSHAGSAWTRVQLSGDEPPEALDAIPLPVDQGAPPAAGGGDTDADAVAGASASRQREPSLPCAPEPLRLDARHRRSRPSPAAPAGASPSTLARRSRHARAGHPRRRPRPRRTWPARSATCRRSASTSRAAWSRSRRAGQAGQGPGSRRRSSSSGARRPPGPADRRRRARSPSTRAWSSPTPRVAGVASASSAAGSCPRR